jgi:predicted nucleic acid-binding protein
VGAHPRALLAARQLQQRELEQPGRRMPIEGSYIAATARCYNLTIVTGNDKHYRRPGLKLFNPFAEARLQD